MSMYKRDNSLGFARLCRITRRNETTWPFASPESKVAGAALVLLDIRLRRPCIWAFSKYSPSIRGLAIVAQWNAPVQVQCLFFNRCAYKKTWQAHLDTFSNKATYSQ